MVFDLSNGFVSGVIDTHGGEMVCLRDGAGTEYIWSGDPAYWAGRNPILFPIVGTLRNSAARFRGRDISLSRHGFARDMEFAVVQQGSDFARLELCQSAETLERYPWSFRLLVEHRLTADGFSTQFTVENPGTEPMPFCIGAHTAYRCPLHEGERFDDYRLIFDQPETAPAIPIGPDGLLLHGKGVDILHGGDTIELCHDIFDRADTLIFDGLRSHGVRLVHRNTGHGVHVDFDGFPMVGFWTMPGKQAPYICIEPWQGCSSFDNDTGDFAAKPHCVVLAPGETRRWQYTVRIL